MVFALHQLDKKKLNFKKKKKKKKKKIFSFATFTVTLFVKKTKQNLTLSELLEGKKNMKEIEKGSEICDLL